MAKPNGFANQKLCCFQMLLDFEKSIEQDEERFKTFPSKPWFLHVCSTSLLKTLWEKENLFVMRNLSFSRSVYYPFAELSDIFIKFEIVVCKLFQFGRVLKFVVWERAKERLLIMSPDLVTALFDKDIFSPNK